MVAPLNDLLGTLRFGQPVCHQRLEVVPLLAPTQQHGVAYITYDEAIAASKLLLEEVGAAGSVPHLLATNLGSERVLIPDGTTLVGCKQNRVVNVTILLESESKTVIPVSCVERGRWSLLSKLFAAGSTGDKELRTKMCQDATRSLKHGAQVRVSQHKVWQHVDDVLRAAKADSPSAAYHAAYAEKQPEFAEFKQAISLPRETVGVAVAVDGSCELVEVFDRPEAFARLWQRLLDGYVVSLGQRPRAQVAVSANAAEFLRRVAQAPHEAFPAVGVGTSVRFESDGLTGAALVCDDQVVHLAAFATPHNTSNSGT